MIVCARTTRTKREHNSERPVGLDFAAIDIGNLSDDYTRLLRFVARIQYPGAGVEGSYDVDGLRSQAVAFARRTVGAGVWRANFKTITAWAHRTRVAADQG